MRGVWLCIVFFIISAICVPALSVETDYVALIRSKLNQQLGKPPSAEQIVEALNRLGVNMHQKGNYRSAIGMAQQTVLFATAQLGPEHPNTLQSVNNLAMLYQSQGRYEEAEPLYRRALVTLEKVLGSEHPNTLMIVNNLAALYESQGHYGDAESLFKRALAALEKVLGPEHPNTLQSVNNLAMLYQSQGRYGEAEPLYRRALAAREKILGSEHPNTLISVNNLAGLYESQGRYGEAESLFKRALAALEKVLGSEHPNTLQSVNNLAFLYQSQGRYGEAESLFKRALAALEKVLGLEHPNTLISVNNLALLYQSQGRYGEAEPLYRRALAASEKVLGPEHPNTLMSVNNLAGLYESQGRYGEAEPLYQRALAAREKVLGPEHPNTLMSVNNLAGLYESHGRYDEADSLCQRALAAREKVLGPEHPDTLISVNNLAFLYQSQGRYGEAEPLFQRALTGREKVLGPEHPDTIDVQLNYAVNLVNLKKPQEALKQLSRLEPRLLELAALRLRHTRQEYLRRRFLFDQSTYQNVVLTLAVKQDKPEYIELAGHVILRWKQIQGDEESFLARLARSRGTSDEIKSLAADIARLRADLTVLINQANAPADLQRRKLNELEAKEIQLARLSPKFKKQLEVRRANLHDVSSGLPRDAVLLEFRRYWPFDFRQGREQAPRFLAMLLDARGELSLHDLADVAEVNGSWRELRGAYTKETAAGLYQLLFSKLEVELKRYKTVYIAPDHFLNLIAFSQLVTPEGRYWLEHDQSIRHVSTGRHLIKDYVSDLDKPRGLIAIGGVRYDDFSRASAKSSQPSNEMLKNDKLIADVSAANRVLRSELGRFTRLKQTEWEAIEVAHRYWDKWNTQPRVWKGFDAMEGRLKALNKPPNVLHLATHGFYLSSHDSLIDRPMMLSGLALVGANLGRQGRTGPDREDGILYALEALNLNLGNTELVALSACDTGAGTLDYSEGVYGLVRAFHIAGARNVLMSLWKLSDFEAREFMKRFYSNWLSGSKPKDLAVALKQTQLSFINDSNPRLRDPNVWAPYVLVESR